MNELFSDKTNRDKRAKELQAQGKTVRRSTVRNQRLHPAYVKDYIGEVDNGFGNSQYLTTWPTLYVVDVLQ